MKKDDVLKLLRTHKTTLAQRFGVKELALFGSFAPDQDTSSSRAILFDRNGMGLAQELALVAKRFTLTGQIYAGI